MNAVRTFALGLVVLGGFPAANLWAQCPTVPAPAVPAPAVPAQVTQWRAFSYEPALAAPRAYAPNYVRRAAPNYGRPAYMVTKTLR